MTVVAGIVSALLLLAATASGPPSGLIAFADDERGIFVMNHDGSGKRALGAGFGPIWSPDGTHLAACCVGDRIAVVRLEDGAVTHVASGGQPAWSHDGQQLTFVRATGSASSDVFVVDVDGQNERRVTDDSWLDAAPAWSPDGKHIAYASQRFPWQVIVIRTDGTGERAVGRGEGPSWSPDGARLAFSFLDSQPPESGLFVSSLDGHRTIRVGWEAARAPVWSADGSRLLYTEGWRRGVCTRCREPSLQVVVANADGSGSARLTHSQEVDVTPSWSPGGSRIVFGRRPTDVVLQRTYTMNADGTCETLLTAGGDPAWQRVPGGVAPGTIDCIALGLRDASAPERVLGSLKPFALTVTVVNDGTLPATDVVVEERPNRRVRLVSARAGQGACTVGRSGICRLGTLAARGEAVVMFVGRAPAGRVSRTVRVRAAGADGYPEDNAISTATYVNPCTMVGTGARDVISGTSGRDVICGKGGPDELVGGAGADRIEGGDGSDRVIGGTGRDRLFGDGGRDRILARDGERDSIGCGPGFDRVLADRRDLVGAGCERVMRR